MTQSKKLPMQIVYREMTVNRRDWIDQRTRKHFAALTAKVIGNQ